MHSRRDAPRERSAEVWGVPAIEFAMPDLYGDTDPVQAKTRRPHRDARVTGVSVGALCEAVVQHASKVGAERGVGSPEMNS
jgi:hypothetical protein